MMHRGGLLLALLIAGCEGNQSALEPAGPQAERIHALYLLILYVTAAVYFLVMLFVAIPSIRRRKEFDESNAPDVTPDPTQERRFDWWVGGSLVATTLILFVFLAGDFYTGEKLHALSEGEPVHVKVTAYQWWWEVEYRFEKTSDNFVTANEIHLPVGRPALIELASNDVIHSFWVPNLHGKRDMIPGHPTRTYIQADEPGTYMGQCAEFCGLEHAFMRLVVVAETQEEFDTWCAAQRSPAPEPQEERQKLGRDVFLDTSCVLCHTIGGTQANGRVGPNLTHVASRPLIAGKLENRREHLREWVLNAQHVKPGARMPSHALTEEQVEPLLDYLQMLQ